MALSSRNVHGSPTLVPQFIVKEQQQQPALMGDALITEESRVSVTVSHLQFGEQVCKA